MSYRKAVRLLNFFNLVSAGEPYGVCSVREEATCECFGSSSLCTMGSRGLAQACAEAMLVTPSSREGTGEELGLSSWWPQGPRQKRWKGLVIPGKARSQCGRSME